jgi:hypothetical protein
MVLASVSDLDLYRKYREDDDFPLPVFLAQLRRETAATPAMMRGRAFARAMEMAPCGEASVLSADGHTFAFTCDAEIEAWPRREVKAEKEYSGVLVSARCDRILGCTVADDKTTSKYDVEGYIDKFQWRFYLDMFDADVFRWHIWECHELSKPTEWEVYAHHLLVQYRYPRMEEELYELADDFRRFALSIGYEKRASDKA